MTDLDSRRRDRVDYADYLSDEPAPGHRRYRRHGVSGPYRGFGRSDHPAYGDAADDDADYGDYEYYGDYSDYGDYEDYGDYDYEEDEGYGEGGARAGVIDQWRPVAITAAVILVIAVVATALILQGGGNGGTAGTVSAPPTRTVIATPPAPTTSLPAETVTSVPPPQSTTAAPSSTPPTTTPPSATAPPPPTTAPAPDPRTVTYTVTGTKPLLDLVTIVYTDEQGFPRTDVNVALPWSRRVVVNPGVAVRSVTASSLRSELNCTITDAAGRLIARSATNSILATCTL
ncbi:hypothetical protein H7J77_08795 [Mycolicibacillus parakoreensis]|uniref:MmpS family transport accessory protein n=1 Tax=Mycolicibacillus parakoreensis TaxID=1069221 RepID=A0ABY3TW32_9MYCO|nr:MmpS family transport accessory protein [Mycolicibacillus parakoreensis]MCV7315639.1 hypothetical protein [Mycolicibacillus parakoreensis]ULN51922.1 MmpS family transport accessory protein [Mycolicibacillus parakoreensis]